MNKKLNRLYGFIILGWALMLPAKLDAQIFDIQLGEETYTYNYFQKPDSSFLVLKEKYNQAVLSGNAKEQGILLGKMGEVCFHMGQFPQALDYYYDAIQLFSQHKNEDLLAYNYLDIGILYYYNKNTNEAGNYFNQALVLFKKLKNKKGIAITYGNIGFTFEKKQDYDSAQYYQQLALTEYNTINDKLGMAKIYENIGSIYEDLGKYDSAMHYFQKALERYKNSGEQILHIEVLNNIGDVYRKTGNYRQALQYSFQAIKISKETDEFYQLSSAYRDVAKAYNLLNKNDSAFYYNDLSRQYLAEIYSKENSKQIAFLQVQNSIKKKNRDIEILQNAQRINKIIGVSVIVIVILFVVLIGVGYNRQKLKVKNEQAINEQNKQIFEAQNQLLEAEIKTKTLEEDKLKALLLAEQLEKEKLDAELKNKHLEETILKEQIELKTKELTTSSLNVIQKNQLLENLRSNIEAVVNDDKRDQKKQMKQLLLLINQNFNNDNYWEDFKNTFEQIHQSFFEQLKKFAPDLSASELRLVCLLKMNMSSNDMATMLGISMDSLRVARYRLRKKLNIEQGENLMAFIQNI